MKWSKQTEECWRAFTDAVLSKDKNQFNLFHKYYLSVELDKKNLIEEKELEQ